jgi:hypothetical protein
MSFSLSLQQPPAIFPAFRTLCSVRDLRSSPFKGHPSFPLVNPKSSPPVRNGPPSLFGPELYAVRLEDDTRGFVSVGVYSIRGRVSIRNRKVLPSFFFHGQEGLRKGIDREENFFCNPPPGGSRGEASSARPFRSSGTRVMALTGVPPPDASLSHSY